MANRGGLNIGMYVGSIIPRKYPTSLLICVTRLLVTTAERLAERSQGMESLLTKYPSSGVPVSPHRARFQLRILTVWNAEGQQLRYCGVGAGYDNIIMKGSASSMKVWPTITYRGE